MAEGRFLSYRDITDPSAKLFHPCYFAEDLTGDEMEALRQVMETMWGFDEDSSDPMFDFHVEPSARENLAEFVRLSEEWRSYHENGIGGPFYHHTHQLEEWTQRYADQIRVARQRLPRGAYLLADFGGGQGEVFNYVDSLNDRELEILSTFLSREIHDRGGIFDLAIAADLAVENPAEYIRIKWDWESSEDERRQSDSDDTLTRANALSENLIFEIQTLRETTAAAEVDADTETAEDREDLPVVTDDPPKAGSGSPPLASRPFIPTPLQKAILAALAGQALKKQALADLICKGEGTVLYREGGIKELRALGLVEHKRRIGFFRPDAPPEGAIMPDETVPKVSPK